MLGHLRGTIKKITDNEPRTMLTTIDDPAILDDIGETLKGSRRLDKEHGGPAWLFEI